jgi:hypothetical protein
MVRLLLRAAAAPAAAAANLQRTAPQGEAAAECRAAAAQAAALGAAASPAALEALAERVVCNSVGLNAHGPVTAAVASLGVAAVGIGLFARASMFNHSCEPTAEFRYEGGRLVALATRDVAAGEGLLVSYTDCYQERDERRAELHGKYGFECDCPRCADRERAAVQDARMGGLRCPRCGPRGGVPPSEAAACAACGREVAAAVAEKGGAAYNALGAALAAAYGPLTETGKGRPRKLRRVADAVGKAVARAAPQLSPGNALLFAATSLLLGVAAVQGDAPRARKVAAAAVGCLDAAEDGNELQLQRKVVASVLGEAEAAAAAAAAAA